MEQSGAQVLLAKGEVKMDQSGAVLLVARSVKAEHSGATFLIAREVEGDLTGFLWSQGILYLRHRGRPGGWADVLPVPSGCSPGDESDRQGVVIGKSKRELAPDSRHQP